MKNFGHNYEAFILKFKYFTSNIINVKLAQVLQYYLMQKMTTILRTLIFMWPMRRLDMHLIWPNFFFFWLWGKCWKKIFLLTAIWFYQIPKKFLKMFSIAPHFYPICFPQNCPHFTCITRPSIFNRNFYFREFAKL